MKLEYSILEHLSNHDNGTFVDITFIEEDHVSLRKTLNDLEGRNMILVDENSARDFEAFGIGNDRKKRIKAKIKMMVSAWYRCSLTYAGRLYVAKTLCCEKVYVM